MKKYWGKVLGIFLTFVLVLVVIAGYVGLKEIKKIRAAQKYEFDTKEQTTTTANEKPTAQASKLESTNAVSEDHSQAAVSNDNSSSASKQPEEKAKRSSPLELINTFKDLPLIRTCEDFDGKSRLSRMIQKQVAAGSYEGELEKGLTQLITSESVIAATIFQFSLPLGHKMIELNEQLGEDFLSNLKYASIIYQHKKELEQNLERAKQVQTRNLYASTWGLTMIAHPELIGDAEATQTCAQIANLETNLSKEQLEEILRGFMARAQLKADDNLFAALKSFPEVKIVWTEIGFKYDWAPIRFDVVE